MEDVVGSHHIRLHGLHGEELTGGNLLERSGVEDVVHPAHGVADAPRVPHVADEETHLSRLVRVPLLQHMAHVVLLLLVAREDADLAHSSVEEVLEHGRPERAGAAGNHERAVLESVACLHVCHLLCLLPPDEPRRPYPKNPAMASDAFLLSSSTAVSSRSHAESKDG